VCVYSNNRFKYTVMADVQNWQASRSSGPRGVEVKKAGIGLLAKLNDPHIMYIFIFVPVK
jgi:hypothetical protein